MIQNQDELKKALYSFILALCFMNVATIEFIHMLFPQLVVEWYGAVFSFIVGFLIFLTSMDFLKEFKQCQAESKPEDSQ